MFSQMMFELVNCFVTNRFLKIVEAQIEQKLRSSFSEYRVAYHNDIESYCSEMEA